MAITPYYDELRPPSCRGEDLDFLLALGWYPMNQLVFTTSHLFGNEGFPVNQVHWLRYPLSEIKERGSHRRIHNKNQNFTVKISAPFEHSHELNDLYERYFDSVDFDGYPSIERATFSPDEKNIYDSRAIIVRDGEKAVACGIFHEGANSVASILHFYDPEYKKYSPGKYLILKTLDYCRTQNLGWYYPGYVIEGNPKMDYKLFLGRDIAQYYHPEPDPLSGRWLSYTEGNVLNP